MASWMASWLESNSLTASDVAAYSLLLLVTWLAYKAVEPLWSPLRKVSCNRSISIVISCGTQLFLLKYLLKPFLYHFISLDSLHTVSSSHK